MLRREEVTQERVLIDRYPPFLRTLLAVATAAYGFVFVQAALWWIPVLLAALALLARFYLFLGLESRTYRCHMGLAGGIGLLEGSMDELAGWEIREEWRKGRVWRLQLRWKTDEASFPFSSYRDEFEARQMALALTSATGLPLVGDEGVLSVPQTSDTLP